MSPQWPKNVVVSIINRITNSFIIQLIHSIQYVDKINILKYLNVLQHVSDHRGSIIREPLQCLDKNYENDSILPVDMDSGRCYVSIF